MSHDYISIHKDDFEDITTIEMCNSLIYEVNDSEIAYQVKLVRVISNSSDSLYFQINESGSRTYLEKIIFRINDAENIPLELTKKDSDLRCDNNYRYYFEISVEKFRDICKANKIIFKVKSERIGDCVFGDTDNDMLLDYCRVFYNQTYDSKEFANAIPDCETIENIATQLSETLLYKATGIRGEINQDKVRSACSSRGCICEQQLFDRVMAILEENRWLHSNYGAAQIDKISNKAFLLLCADTIFAIEKEANKDKVFILELNSDPVWSETKINIEYIITLCDRPVSFRCKIVFDLHTYEHTFANFHIYIFEFSQDGQSITHSVLDSAPNLVAFLEEFSKTLVRTYKHKFKSLLQNINYYEDLSHSLTDDSINDGTWFDVLPSLYESVGGDSNEQQPQNKNADKPKNHDANSPQPQNQHHDDENMSLGFKPGWLWGFITKHWKVILFVIGLLLLIFY